MNTVEKALAGMFFLIGVFLVIGSSGATNTGGIITNFSTQLTKLTKTLQGRTN